MIELIRNNFEKVIEILEKRYMHELIPIAYKIKYLDEAWRKTLKELDKLRHKRNVLAKEIGKLKREGKDITNLIKEAKELDNVIPKYEKNLKQIEREIKELLLLIPNEIDERVPIGIDDSYNKPIEYKFLDNFKVKSEETAKKLGVKKYKVMDVPPYWELLKKYVNTEKAGKITGSRFYYELDKLVFLDLALGMYALDFYYKKGFTPMITPYLMKKDVEAKITYYSAFEDTIFSLDDLILIPTSEHSIVAFFENENLDETKRIVAITPAFRREASSQQKDIKGIFRVRQFHKVELHVVTDEENEEKELQNLIKVFKELIESLGISYRIVINSSGDMDRRAKIQYDLEGWFPSQENFRELGSIATMGKWVSEKLNIKIKNKYAINLYATGLAIQRTICALVENNYDGEKIKIPKPLKKYLPFDEL